MKKIITLLVFFFLITSTLFANQTRSPWRDTEKQVKIVFAEFPNTASEVQKIIESANSEGFNISYEGANGFIRCYVTDDEYEYLISRGLKPEIEIGDLNSWSASFGSRGVPPGYYTVNELNDIADSLALHFPTICSKSLIGYGSFNDPIYILKISDNVEEDENEPELLFDGGIHGDEVGGPENVIRFARDLCLNYGTDPDFTYAVDNAETWLIYCLNPYGRNFMTRYNANGVDVNRDCGYMWDGEGNSSGAFSQPESKIIRNFLHEHQTTNYISFHSGTVFISYPWSYREELTPDDANHNFMAQQYALNSGYTNIPLGPGYTGMYPINGSTKDFGYGATSSLAWSVEISLSKQPSASQVVPYYNKNKYAMLTMITLAVNQGISGALTDSITGEPLVGTVTVDNLYPVKSNQSEGDFHKFLVPGTYTVNIHVNGYIPQIIENVTILQGLNTVVNVSMIKGGGYFSNSLTSCCIPNNNTEDEGNTPAASNGPDSIKYSLGRNGYIVVDMGIPVLNRTGDDIRVYENDDTPEGYNVYAGDTPDGPWSFLGSGIATATFDLADTLLLKARYIKITDDGNGTSQAPDAGFDLDAVENLHPDTLTVGWVNGYIYNDQEPYFLIPGALVILNGDSCYSDDNGFYSIASSPGEFIINAYAPYYEGNDTIIIALGDTLMHDMFLSLKESTNNLISTSLFSVFPIPAIDQITVSGPGGTYLMEIYNMNSEKIVSSTLSIDDQGGKIKTNSLKRGFYILRLSNDTYSVILRLIIL